MLEYYSKLDLSIPRVFPCSLQKAVYQKIYRSIMKHKTRASSFTEQIQVSACLPALGLITCSCCFIYFLPDFYASSLYKNFQEEKSVEVKHVYHKKFKGTKTLPLPTTEVLPQQQAQIQLSFEVFLTCSHLFFFFTTYMQKRCASYVLLFDSCLHISFY